MNKVHSGKHLVCLCFEFVIYFESNAIFPENVTFF